MSGERLLLDTNTVVHFLAGRLANDQARNLLNKEVHLSFITEIELRSFRGADERQKALVARFLSRSVIIDVNAPIKDRAVHFRLEYGLKTPDAIIAATASLLNLPLLTADKTLFRAGAEIDVRPAVLSARGR